MSLPYELIHRKYPVRIVDKITSDERLKNIEGRIIAYDRCTYKDGKELRQYGYRISCIVDTGDWFKHTVGISIWMEEDSEYLFIDRVVDKPGITRIKKDRISEIVDCIVGIILEEKLENKIREMIV